MHTLNYTLRSHPQIGIRVIIQVCLNYAEGVVSPPKVLGIYRMVKDKDTNRVGRIHLMEITESELKALGPNLYHRTYAVAFGPARKNGSRMWSTSPQNVGNRRLLGRNILADAVDYSLRMSIDGVTAGRNTPGENNRRSAAKNRTAHDDDEA